MVDRLHSRLAYMSINSMSTVHSFVEDSTWDREDKRRPAKHTVVYRLRMYGRHDEEFVSDYGLFYDPDDRVLLGTLSEKFTEMDWERMIFWKDQDRVRIKIIDPSCDREIGTISVRSGVVREFDQVDWTNVVSMVRHG